MGQPISILALSNSDIPGLVKAQLTQSFFTSSATDREGDMYNKKLIVFLSSQDSDSPMIAWPLQANDLFDIKAAFIYFL